MGNVSLDGLERVHLTGGLETDLIVIDGWSGEVEVDSSGAADTIRILPSITPLDVTLLNSLDGSRDVVEIISMEGSDPIDYFPDLIASGAWNVLTPDTIGPITIDSDRQVLLGGDSEFASLRQNSDRSLTVTNEVLFSGTELSIAGSISGGTFENHGEITLEPTGVIGGTLFSNFGALFGSGQLTARLENQLDAEVSIDAGDLLRLDNVGSVNHGAITVTAGQLHVNEFVNRNGGLILGSGSIVIDSLLTNEGTIGLSGGANDITGNLSLAANSTLIASGPSAVSIDSIVLDETAVARLANGPGTTITGSVGGAGIIDNPTPTTIAGTISPGSPYGVVGFTGDVTMTDTARLEIEIAGTEIGTTYDKLEVQGRSPSRRELGGVLT